jgi:N6-adenosine-specific RNA methylase IME4
MGRFKVVYLDPPWDYWRLESTDANTLPFATLVLLYPLMRLDELERLDVPRIASDHAVMFLWVLDGYLQQGIGAMEAWGFSYRTVAFVWVKTHGEPVQTVTARGRLVNEFRIRPRHVNSPITLGGSELCLIGHRGQPVKNGVFVPYTGVRKVVFAPSPRGHSSKPPIFRDLIQRRLTKARANTRLEMFARGEAPGWTLHGNQAVGRTIEVPMRGAA